MSVSVVSPHKVGSLESPRTGHRLSQTGGLSSERREGREGQGGGGRRVTDGGSLIASRPLVSQRNRLVKPGVSDLLRNHR